MSTQATINIGVSVIAGRPMNQYAMLIGRSLGRHRFVVTNDCRLDIPVGAVFNTLASRRNKLEAGEVVLEASGPIIEVGLRILSVEFWRKPHDCVPYGHHASVVFEGSDLEVLKRYLVEHPSPWHVSLSSGP